MENIEKIRQEYYQHVHRSNKGRNEPRWRGTRVVKYPSDLILYSEVIFSRTPDFIIETGTRFGGSANYFADMLALFNPSGKVISVDVESYDPPPHALVEYWRGSSTDPEIVARIKARVGDKKVMVVLDSDHSYHHVKNELLMYCELVTKDQYMIVEDCWTDKDTPYPPGQAVSRFLEINKEFVLEPLEDRFVFGVTRGGWLHRI